nr:Chain EEE, Melanoma-associated antigen 10 [Homo sapiens]7PDW_EEE Chain EEE, Melanoma-associated antigen 10 [Homo sapiens]7PDW_JJJ Chain JJJ, Melanoma-associated antigen 10 [Homo sapiens]7QPJ_E Chain E, Melanoma-associated antigen 10 [Homo sapiens]
GLYDGMEHL